MVKWLSSPPTFADERKTMVMEVLHLLLVAHIAIVLVFTLVFVLALPLVEGAAWAVIPGASVLLLVDVSLLAIARRGHTGFAAWTICAVFWLAVTASALAQGGIDSPNLVGQLTIVVIAGLLLGSRPAALFALGSGASLVAILLAGREGLLPPPAAPVTDGVVFVLLLGNLTVIAVPLYLVVKRTNEWVERARTSERQAEENLERLVETQDQLMHAGRMEALGRLAGGVAHDFNNVLTAIVGHAELLRDRMDSVASSQSADEELVAIHEAVERATRLTGQLLAFSRTGPRDPEVVALNEAVTGTYRMLRRLITEEVELRLDLTEQPAFVLADRGQLEQVLMNLVVNAGAAMPSGGLLQVSTALEREADPRVSSRMGAGPFVTLKVSDSGEGMDEETLAHVFEPFFTTKAPGEGTGLGLATVHAIVEESGGMVTVDSVKGEGSVFTVWLPRARGKPVSATPRPPREPHTTSNETILVIEDEPSVRRVIAQTLERRGYHVLVAEDGPSAMRQVEQHGEPIDMVVSDVVLPGGMRGPAIVQALAEAGHVVPALFVSGYPDLGDSGGHIDPKHLLGKPFESAELHARVRSMLDASQAAREDSAAS